MRLLLVGAIPPPTGGDATWAVSYINNHLMKDIDIETVNTSFIGRRADTLGIGFSLWDEVKRAVYIWGRVVNKILRFRPHIAHLNCNCSPRGVLRDLIVILTLRGACVPVILHCHANVPDAIGNSKISRLILKLCLSWVGHVVVLNRESLNYCSQLALVKCTIVPNFINEEDLIENRKIKKELKKVLFVGHMIQTKGLFEVVEVARRFSNLSFIMAGAITSEVNDLNAPVNMFFKGNLDKVALKIELERADLFIFPTHTEGFSMALLEAMACGLPVITTPVGANYDMIKHGGGLIVSVGDVDAICHALMQMQNELIRSGMSIWNVNKVRNSYISSRVIPSLRAIYSETLRLARRN